ncbi:2-amino-4-hydroxy-6-hydroxymethyldihydropteridine diphosphokinase [Bacteroidales bacterium OttesenSCG-928-C03]|nr:2-amino-4-hydroxy-6-hydroxymethyldihydropteridine diphosphokinase [Bacteroidales bacterium OttesenSCG-928-C03]MDL2326848.1 2-amino-4-hydroxy-6-hydroxymethyldihydropteridine diphosphokinase [Bacteroidales bacterium OttesenSCG-928-A14]
MEEVVLSLGGNVGDRDSYLQQARQLIMDRIGEITRLSSVRETEAWGFDSEPFLNQVVVVETELPPMELLEVLKKIEIVLGRNHKTEYHDGQAVYHSRTMDIDILYYSDFHIETENLTIPHPRICEREFVLAPLRELMINPYFCALKTNRTDEQYDTRQ